MSDSLSRRDILKFTAAVAASAAMLNITSAATDVKPVSMGFIGVGNRGATLLKQVLARKDVMIPAVCDINASALNSALDLVEKSSGKRPKGYSNGPADYRRLIARDDLQAVLIATPQELHTMMAVDAMNAGKFVGCEVPAACTMDECHQLVAVQRKTRAGYMMLENYLYSSFVMQVQNMVDHGLFGELTYGAGNYIHEIRAMKFNADGSLTWRGENVRDNIGVIYPTHALGPVSRWMGINKTDKLVSLVAMASLQASTHHYAIEKFGKDSAAAKVDFKNGDTNQALIKTARGRLIEIRYDTSSPRPPGMGQYSLQGTRGAYESALGERMVYLEGKTAGDKWEPLGNYSAEYQHPRWKRDGKAAQASGHNGGDYFVIDDFVNSIRSGESAIDVIDAVTWSSVRPLSAESIAGGGIPVKIPDFSAA